MSAAEQTSLAILGAGPGGLTLAEFLRLRGFTGASLIERAPRVGGKSDSLDLGDLIAEMGTCYATGAHKDVLAWMKRQGAPFRILRRTSIDGASLKDYIGTAGGPPLPAQVLTYLGKRERLLGQLRATPDKASVLREAAMPAEAWLSEQKLPKMIRLMYRAVTALGYGYLNEVSIYQAMQWVDFHTIMSGATGKLIMPARGWTDFWETLAGPHDVRLSREVTRIERGPEGALIHFSDGARLAAHALACTIPVDDWNRLVTDPSTDEKAVAAAITWKGYATSLIVVENWFTSEDIRSFSRAFLPGSYPGQLISARYEGHSPDFGGHLYVTGQIPGDYTPAELRIFLERDLADLGAKLVNVVNAKTWRYFPHYDLKALEDGLLSTLARMQGASRTWYSGASFSHESVANVSRLNKALAPRLISSLRA
ncbi:FAD-dependent oxidoreductase [Hyphomonas sp.]|uniref:FAD-dependent oxidoreductase n=1 Tax=Hyphomonas sp. TaxID=87 RepID=UPI00391AE75B